MSDRSPSAARVPQLRSRVATGSLVLAKGCLQNLLPVLTKNGAQTRRDKARECRWRYLVEVFTGVMGWRKARQYQLKSRCGCVGNQGLYVALHARDCARWFYLDRRWQVRFGVGVIDRDSCCRSCWFDYVVFGLTDAQQDLQGVRVLRWQAWF